MAGDHKAGVAPRRAGAHLSLLDDRRLPAAAGEFIGDGQADGAGPDHQNIHRLGQRRVRHGALLGMVGGAGICHVWFLSTGLRPRRASPANQTEIVADQYSVLAAAKQPQMDRSAVPKPS